MKALADDLNVCSKRGLSERFDSTIGAGTVLMPFGGKTSSPPYSAWSTRFPSKKAKQALVRLCLGALTPI